ncbi:hypothetical protein [Paenibacillus eucommiae]|uniref:Uncharacterized protein n=1 Tax=Paenibacillus eucommiae TaxID=1355755 RepID=A0ABS4IQE6_9BACL|nr:hypothetical protein [Paenibacillus eucommiae]MBP1989784.1 hypothetical protein [Paenibacillus eucommiae]
MPKNDADPKYDREDNKADKKDNQHNLNDEAPTLTSNKDTDYVPSLNGIPKDEV